VMWTAAIQQESGLGVLPIIVVVFILLVGAGIWILQVSTAREEEVEEVDSSTTVIQNVTYNIQDTVISGNMETTGNKQRNVDSED